MHQSQKNSNEYVGIHTDSHLNLNSQILDISKIKIKRTKKSIGMLCKLIPLK